MTSLITDQVALLALLRHIQSEPVSYSVFMFASASERAADEIERLQRSLTARDELLEQVLRDNPYQLKEKIRAILAKGETK